MPREEDIQVSGVTIRPHERVALAHGHPVELTPREFEILLRLAERPGWVLSSDQLADGSQDGDFSPESISVHVSRLRRKLLGAGSADLVQTVRGFGYRLQVAEGDGRVESTTEAGRTLKDASWELEEAVLQAQHAGSDAQRAAAAEALERARSEIYALLAGPAEPPSEPDREE